ncbi:hypothetical protein ICNINCKA_02013 [Synechococcus sp. CBW1107]|nr:hypothetical protein ICNINCKA_02013 [Synechococcus sp. CBW1107]
MNPVPKLLPNVVISSKRPRLYSNPSIASAEPAVSAPRFSR